MGPLVCRQVGAYPGGDQALCMTFYNYTIPAADTTYVCRAFAFPPGCVAEGEGRDPCVQQRFLFCSVPLHALRFEPLLDPRGAPYLHHMILYSTPADLSGLGYFPCEMPPAESFIWVWAVGMGASSLPPRVGMRVGSGQGGVQYGLLQVCVEGQGSGQGRMSATSTPLSPPPPPGALSRCTTRTRPSRPARSTAAACSCASQISWSPSTRASSCSEQTLAR